MCIRLRSSSLEDEATRTPASRVLADSSFGTHTRKVAGRRKEEWDMDAVSVEFLGFAAGLMNLTSSVPQLVANLRKPDCAARQSASRNALQCAGNCMWLAYGISVGSMSMTTFSSLGCLMAGTLLWQVLRAKLVSKQGGHQETVKPLGFAA